MYQGARIDILALWYVYRNLHISPTRLHNLNKPKRSSSHALRTSRKLSRRTRVSSSNTATCGGLTMFCLWSFSQIHSCASHQLAICSRKAVRCGQRDSRCWYRLLRKEGPSYFFLASFSALLMWYCLSDTKTSTGALLVEAVLPTNKSGFFDRDHSKEAGCVEYDRRYRYEQKGSFAECKSAIELRWVKRR